MPFRVGGRCVSRRFTLPVVMMSGRNRGRRVERWAIRSEEFLVVSVPLPTLGPLVSAGLSAAEREVTSMILDGMSNREVARARKTSVRTVANQVASVFKKLGVSCRLELASRVMELEAANRAVD